MFESAEALDIRALRGHEFVKNIFDSRWASRWFPVRVGILMERKLSVCGGVERPKTRFVMPTGCGDEGTQGPRDSQHRHHPFLRTRTAPYQCRVLNQVVHPKMQGVLEHLRKTFNIPSHYMSTFDGPSLISFPPSLSTTTPQKNTHLVIEATLEGPACCQSSPEARGTAFLGEVLKTMDSTQK